MSTVRSFLVLCIFSMTGNAMAMTLNCTPGKEGDGSFAEVFASSTFGVTDTAWGECYDQAGHSKKKDYAFVIAGLGGGLKIAHDEFTISCIGEAKGVYTGIRMGAAVGASVGAGLYVGDGACTVANMGIGGGANAGLGILNIEHVPNNWHR